MNVEKLNEFLASNEIKRRKSILWDYADDIVYLLNRRCNLELIYKYLKETYDIGLAKSSTFSFVSKHKDKLLSMIENSNVININTTQSDNTNISTLKLQTQSNNTTTN